MVTERDSGKLGETFERKLGDLFTLAGFALSAGYLIYALGWSFDMDARPLIATISASFAFLFVALTPLPPKWRANGGLALLSLAIGGAAVDQVLLNLNQKSAAHSRTFVPDSVIGARIATADWRSQEEVTRELQQRVGKINRASGVFHVAPWTDLGRTNGIMPLSMSSNLPWVYCNEGGFWATSKTDRYGFNNDDQAWAGKGRRIMLLGDSFAIGGCVNQPDTVAGQLRQMGYSAVAAATPGSGPLIELASLREYGTVFRPDVVVWFYFDPHMLHRLATYRPDKGWGGEAHSASLMRYLNPTHTQNLAHRQGEVDALWDHIYDRRDEYTAIMNTTANAAALRRDKVNQIRQKLGYKTLGPDEQISIDAAMDLFLDILKQAKRETESWGGKLVFASYSHIERFRAGETSNRDEFLPRIEALGIPVVDVDAAILATGDPMAHFPFRGRPTPFQSGGWSHFNEAGYRVFAEAIAKAATITD
jgi:hypothetical protein